MPVAIDRFANIRRTVAAAGTATLLASAIVMGGIGHALAADDDEDETIDTKFVRGILSSFGLKRDGDAGIDYHERSPLVVPPTRELPPPADSAATVMRDPAWPKDPDVKRRKEVKRKQLPSVAAEQEDMRQLRPDEMAAQRARPNGAAAAGTGAQPGGARPEQLSPSQLGHSGFKWSWTSLFDREGKAVPFVAEPPRTSLTEPPPGLRTPSPKYEYGSTGQLEPTREIGTDAPVGAK
jgi:hypothetical protein